ncbi:MAG TPA: transglycosylase domain-containing protein, partial [Gemmatimonadaceae bacterium]|nr:transglycosylase domain-containing protein [Gemmatimonadaceae bacterium]
MPGPGQPPPSGPPSRGGRWLRWRRRRRGSPEPWRLLPDPGWLRSAWKPLLALAVLVATVGTFEAWLATCGFDRCPSIAEIEAFEPAEGGRILDRDGTELGKLEAIRRINVPLSSVPEHVRQAFIATEDRRFYDHDGVDFR